MKKFAPIIPIIIFLLFTSSILLGQDHTDHEAVKIFEICVGMEHGVQFWARSGHCTLVIAPSGETMMVDAGPDQGTLEYSIYPTLQRQNITRLNHIISTHYDADHTEGFCNIIQSSLVDSSWTTAYDIGDKDPWSSYTCWKDELTAKGIPRISLANPSGDPAPATEWPLTEFKLGSGPYGDVMVYFFSSNGYIVDGHYVNTGSDQNARSISLVVNYNGFDMFIGGDLTGCEGDPVVEKPVGEAIVAAGLSIDVFHADHHGSSYCNCADFLEIIKPENSVVGMCGSEWGLPTKVAIERIKAVQPPGNYVGRVYQTGPAQTDPPITDLWYVHATLENGANEKNEPDLADRRNVLFTTNGCEYYIIDETYANRDSKGTNPVYGGRFNDGPVDVDESPPVLCGLKDKIYILKADGGTDYNLYLYNSPHSGDITYWNAITRNPSALGRDFWVIPSGNNIVNMVYLGTKDSDGRDINTLAVMKDEGGDHNLYVYNSPLPGDWTYWDAVARNPNKTPTPGTGGLNSSNHALALDLWIIPAGNDTAIMSTTDILDASQDPPKPGSDGIDELVLIKDTSGGQKLFIYNAPRPGDHQYVDSFLRNWNVKTENFYIAKDEWYIPRSSNVAAMAGMRVVKAPGEGGAGKEYLWNEGIVTVEGITGDQNLFVWKVPGEGVDTELENRVTQIGLFGVGSPQAQDLWIVTQRNDIQAMTGFGADTAGNPGNTEGDYDVLGVLGNMWGDDNFWVWKCVQPGDETYPQARLRQDGYSYIGYPTPTPVYPSFGQPQARDYWVMPGGNNVRQIAALPASGVPPTPTPDLLRVWFEAYSAGDPDHPYKARFEDESWSSAEITLYEWDFYYNLVTFNTMSEEKDPEYDYDDDDDFTVAHRVTDSQGRTETVARSYIWQN